MNIGDDADVDIDLDMENTGSSIVTLEAHMLPIMYRNVPMRKKRQKIRRCKQK